MAAFGVVCLVAGCSSEPTEAGFSGRPGTPLGDGLEVVDGTTLLADPRPYLSADGEMAGWLATSVVDGGDPLAVVDAYLDQAEAAGLTPQGEPTCAPDPTPTGFICTGFARSGDPADPRSMSVTFLRGQRVDLVSNHVIVTFSSTDVTSSSDMPTSGGGGDVSLPDARPWGQLPEVGEALPADGEVTRRIVIQPGSRLAGPPHLSLDDATGGTHAIFEVTGEPIAVFDAYLEHLHDLGLEGAPPTERRSGGVVVTEAFANVAGGDDVFLRLVERPDRPTWLWLSAGHD